MNFRLISLVAPKLFEAILAWLTLTAGALAFALTAALVMAWTGNERLAIAFALAVAGPGSVAALVSALRWRKKWARSSYAIPALVLGFIRQESLTDKAAASAVFVLWDLFRSQRHEPPTGQPGSTYVVQEPSPRFKNPAAG